MHGKKTKAVGSINKVRTLVGRGRESSKSVWKPMSRECHMKLYVCFNFFRVKRKAQLAVNLILTWLCLTLSPIKHPEKTLSLIILFQIICIQALCLDLLPCFVWIWCVCFSFLLMNDFSCMSLHGTGNHFPRSQSEFCVPPVADRFF